MKHIITVLVGSCLLTGCFYQPSVNVLTCVGAPAMPLRNTTVDNLNRDELTHYLRYKTWWKKNCKPQEDYSVRAFEGLSTLR